MPEAARGAGVGGQLAKAALDWAAGRKNPTDQAGSGGNDDAGGEDPHQVVILSCSFAFVTEDCRFLSTWSFHQSLPS